MSSKNIIITDILDSGDIDNNTPIIIIKNISSEYLIKSYNNIYWIDINKLYNKLEQKIKFIHNFLPVGQIKTNKKYFTTILANTKLIPTTKTFEKIKNNEWIALIKKNGNINRSIGTFKSIEKPNINIPVFPQKFLQQYTNTSYNKSIYKDLYSHKSLGVLILNKYMFNIDKANLKMIDSTGDISNMCIPDPHINIFNIDTPNKIFFTAQGNISTDGEYNIPNAFDNSTLNNYDNIIDDKKSKNIKLVLREKDNPWFLDYDIVGNAINTANPHKVIGVSSSITENNNNDIYTNRDIIINQKHNNYIIIMMCFLILLFTSIKFIKK